MRHICHCRKGVQRKRDCHYDRPIQLPHGVIKMHPDYKVRKRIVETYDEWAGHKLPDSSAYYFNMEYPQRLDTLRFLLKNWILRAMGDINLYLEIEAEIKALRPGDDAPEVTAIKWLKSQLDSFKDVTPEPNILVIGLMAWGSYIDKMTNGLFKSWLAPGNIPALKQPIIVHILTDNPDKIEAAQSTKDLRALGVNFDYTLLPQALLDWKEKYWLIGIGASLHLSFARHHRAAFHHSFPDTIYAEGFFAGLEKLTQSHRNILMTTHRTDEELMYRSLQPYITERDIIVPPAVLGAFSMNNMHTTALFCRVNTAPGNHLVPMKYFLIWESNDKIFTASPHINPIYLHADTISKLNDRYYVSLDSEMDFVITNDDFYVVQAKDNMCWSELTNRYEGGPADDQFIPFSDLPVVMWRAIMLHDTLKFFMKIGSVPVERTIRSKTPLLEDAFIKAQHQMLCQMTLSADPFKGQSTKRKRQHEK